MDINIRTVDEQSFSVHVTDEATVADLKSAIQQERELSTERQRLLFQGRLLRNDTQTLESAGIRDTSTVHLVYAAPPSATNNDDSSSATTTATTTSQPQASGPGGYTFPFPFGQPQMFNLPDGSGTGMMFTIGTDSNSQPGETGGNIPPEHLEQIHQQSAAVAQQIAQQMSQALGGAAFPQGAMFTGIPQQSPQQQNSQQQSQQEQSAQQPLPYRPVFAPFTHGHYHPQPNFATVHSFPTPLPPQHVNSHHGYPTSNAVPNRGVTSSSSRTNSTSDGNILQQQDRVDFMREHLQVLEDSVHRLISELPVLPRFENIMEDELANIPFLEASNSVQAEQCEPQSEDARGSPAKKMKTKEDASGEDDHCGVNHGENNFTNNGQEEQPENSSASLQNSQQIPTESTSNSHDEASEKNIASASMPSVTSDSFSSGDDGNDTNSTVANANFRIALRDLVYSMRRIPSSVIQLLQAARQQPENLHSVRPTLASLGNIYLELSEVFSGIVSYDTRHNESESSQSNHYQQGNLSQPQEQQNPHRDVHDQHFQDHLRLHQEHILGHNNRHQQVQQRNEGTVPSTQQSSQAAGIVANNASLPFSQSSSVVDLTYPVVLDTQQVETAGQRLRAELVNVEAQQARLAAQRKELIVRETECRRRRLELLRKVQSSPSLQERSTLYSEADELVNEEQTISNQHLQLAEREYELERDYIAKLRTLWNMEHISHQRQRNQTGLFPSISAMRNQGSGLPQAYPNMPQTIPMPTTTVLPPPAFNQMHHIFPSPTIPNPTPNVRVTTRQPRVRVQVRTAPGSRHETTTTTYTSNSNVGSSGATDTNYNRTTETTAPTVNIIHSSGNNDPTLFRTNNTNNENERYSRTAYNEQNTSTSTTTRVRVRNTADERPSSEQRQSSATDSHLESEPLD